jgi:hypothetical protein
MYFKISKNIVRLHDSWLSEDADPNVLYYYDNRFVHSQPGMVDSKAILPLLSVQITMDEDFIIFERKIMTLPYAFSLIGGMMGITFAVIRVLLTLFHGYLLRWSLIKRLILAPHGMSGDKKVRIQPTT